jgi:hypothetical protein
MKSGKHLLFLTLLLLGLITNEPLQAQTTNAAPSELRKAKFSCDSATIQKALDLKKAGWTYVMPAPKSPQAAWGNTDGRTTWFVGYWKNNKTKATSSKQPTKDDAGQFVGDGNGARSWRRGGSPATPTKIQWLCSESGGIAPRCQRPLAVNRGFRFAAAAVSRPKKSMALVAAEGATPEQDKQ